MQFPRLRRATCWLLVPLVLALAAPGWAQSDAELVRARKLYAQGLTQEAAGDWAGALGTFEDVARIKATPQVRFHLARCKEHLGRFNEAFGGYRIAEYEAEQAGAKEQALVDEVRKAREALEARMPKVTIVRGKGAEAIKVELDGVTLGDTQIGQPISLDPGPHVLLGVLEHGKTFKRTLSIAEGDVVRVVLDVPEALGEPTPVPPPSAASAAPKPEARLTEPAPAGNASAPAASPSATPWIIGGLGVASLAVSAVFHSLRLKAEDDLKQSCLGRVCPDTMKGTQQNGETYAALTGVTLGLGVIGVGAGALMLLGRSPTAANAPAAALQIPSYRAGVSFAGRF